MKIDVMVASKEHLRYVTQINDAIDEAAKSRGTGIARRTDEYIADKINSGKAIIAVNREEFVGFCYIESWGHDEFVANSGLIVRPQYRNMGVAKRIKKAAFELSRKRFPNAKIFGLTTGEAVMRINTELGYEPVTFAKLTDAMQQLLDGSSELYEGLETLLEKSQTLVDGVGTLNNGAAALKTGAGSLNAGAAELANGMQTLNGGLSTLSGQSAALNAGAQQVFQSLLAAATTQINAAGLSIPQLTIGNYAEVLNGALASLDQTAVYEQAYQTALAKVTAAVNAQEATIRAAVTAAVQQNVTEQVTAAVREQVTAKVLAAMGLTPETYAAGIADGTISEEQQAQIEAAINAQMASDDVQALISQQVAAQMEEQLRLYTSPSEEEYRKLRDKTRQNVKMKNSLLLSKSAILKSKYMVPNSISVLKIKTTSKPFWSAVASVSATTTRRLT